MCERNNAEIASKSENKLPNYCAINPISLVNLYYILKKDIKSVEDFYDINRNNEAKLNRCKHISDNNLKCGLRT